MTLVCFPVDVNLRAPSVARTRATRVLGEWGLPELCGDVALCLSELVTNPLAQGATEIRVLIEWHVSLGVLDTYVWDDAPGAPEPREPDLYSECGRGLTIVAGLAKEWGHRPSVDGGKIVWARFPVGDR